LGGSQEDREMTKDESNSLAGALNRPDSLKARQDGEEAGKKLVDGRSLRKRYRDTQVTFKTTAAMKERMLQVAAERGMTLTEIIETAFQLFERGK
jgi:hypothetical protein